MSDFKIRIFEPSVPEYRVGLFEGLGRKYGGRIQLWSAPLTSSGTESFPIEGMHFDYTHPLVHFGPFHWQKGLSLRGLTKGDVVVVNGEIKGLSNLFYAILAKIKGIKVIWWGHHWSASSRMWKVLVRLQFVKLLADAYLCYTKTGIDFLRRHGFKNRLVFATGNTINQESIKAAIQNWTQEALLEFQKEHKIIGKEVLLVCGRLTPKMKLDQLFSAVNKLNRENILIAVIGDGVQKEYYLQAARDSCVEDKVMWLGATRVQNVMAPWFLSAKVYVYPGAVGLGILHAFSYGLPVVTHGDANRQMPEFEVMENGKTGLTFKENDISDMSNKIDYLLTHEKACAGMGQYAQSVAFNKYSMANMVANFAEAIESVAHQ